MKTAVVSYIYPAGVKFLDSFLNSLSEQSVQDFELILFNDGVNNLEAHLKEYQNRFRIFPAEGSVIAIRYNSFATLAATEFDAFIFHDIDDRMSINRVEKSRQLLHHYPVVCNDLMLVNENADVLNDSAWSARLPIGFEFDHSFIIDKNIVGLGSSSVLRSILKEPIQFHEDPLAADWFLFYQVLYNTAATAVFTSECKTIYLQYSNNIAGLKEVDEQRLKHVLEVCKLHYSALVDTGYHSMNERLAAIIKKEELIQQQHYNYQSPINGKNLYWWEEKNYLNEKN